MIPFWPLQQLRTWNSSHSCTILFTYNLFTHSYTCALEDSTESSSRRKLDFGFLAIILVILNLFLSFFLSFSLLWRLLLPFCLEKIKANNNWRSVCAYCSEQFSYNVFLLANMHKQRLQALAFTNLPRETKLI
jgi:hypothetical protein